MLKRTIGAAVAFLTLSSLVAAQEHATVVLRSGQHISGQLVELSGLDFTVAVAGIERLVPARDVAVIEFSGGDMQDADWANIPAHQQAVYLKTGAIVTGQLYDISGSSPLKITFLTPAGKREFSSSEVERIVLARPVQPTGTAGKH
jgi:hypothetical protein